MAKDRDRGLCLWSARRQFDKGGLERLEVSRHGDRQEAWTLLLGSIRGGRTPAGLRARRGQEEGGGGRGLVCPQVRDPQQAVQPARRGREGRVPSTEDREVCREEAGAGAWAARCKGSARAEPPAAGSPLLYAERLQSLRREPGCPSPDRSPLRPCQGKSARNSG